MQSSWCPFAQSIYYVYNAGDDAVDGVDDALNAGYIYMYILQRGKRWMSS